METIIVQVVVFQLCFLVVYELLLRKETFFNWNRAYLLITSIVSLVVPFIKLKSFSKVIPSEFIISLPAIILGETKRVDSIGVTDLETVVVNTQSVFSIVWIWYAGIVVFTGVLLFKLFKIWKFKLTSNSVQKKGYSIVTLKNSEEAFSFLKSIFLGDKIENTQKESILTHEKVHVKEKHTIDLLWFEILRIVFWFNPLVYIYQKRITEVHEFIADKSASKYQHNYYESLLAKTFNIAQFSVVNQFYSSSLIKKRIIMLTKEKSNKTKLLKYITIIPIVLSMLVYVSCTDALEIESATETTVSSETTAMEDISRLVYNTLPHDIEKNDITEEQLNSIISKVKIYLNGNSEKVNKDNMSKFSNYYMSIAGKKELDSYSQEHKDIVTVFFAEMFTSEVIREVNNDKEKLKSAICLLTNSKMFNKLNELNYTMPNEAKWKVLYQDYLEKIEMYNSPYSGESEVPFTVIDQSPIYPGCDANATSEELKKCFSREIAIHINKNFNTKIAKTHNLKGRYKIFVAFKIDEQGKLKDLKARAPHETLVTEAKRVLNLLPNMKPGIHEGKTVTVPYSLPIILQIN
ncbi:MAG: hypothetical protein HRT69_07460 [Flavobacteriaceae bacterium]|nr:hypothetical protein [Flavobacteriaceae bacterium]